LWLDGEEDLVQRAQDFVDFANWRLVLQVDWRIEVRDLGVYRFAEHFVLDVVHKFAHFFTLLARPLGVADIAHTIDLIWWSERRSAAKSTASCARVSYSYSRASTQAAHLHGE
jgi:hypothetical protein